ncbi:MAG: ATP phosphoribosyltransferase [Lentisphaeria bacterium]
MLKVALPNKGGLADDALRLVTEAGYSCKRHGRELTVNDPDNAVEFVFLRPRDIPVYVSGGIIELGISGRDLALDSNSGVHEIMGLGFGKSAFYYAVPEDSDLTPDKFDNTRIATSYPGIVEQDLKERGVKGKTVRLDGAIEVSVRLGVADAIADVVSTGRTLKEAGLKTVGKPLMQSAAILMSRTMDICEREDCRAFQQRLEGIVVARNYVVVEYDIPNTALDAACKITPGIESPTIAPLSEKGWSAVKAMVSRKKLNRIMDDLAATGAKGIMVTEIRTCRV